MSATDNSTCDSGVKEIIYSASGAHVIGSTTASGASAVVQITIEGVTTLTYQARDNAGNISAPQYQIVKLDKTGPSVSCGSADSQWHSSDVIIGCTASDATSHLANASDASFNLSTSISLNTETANAATNSRSVTDVAGNSATAGPVIDNKVDKRGRTSASTHPRTRLYLLGQVVAASYSCSDGGSGVASCIGSVPNGQPRYVIVGREDLHGEFS